MLSVVTPGDVVLQAGPLAITQQGFVTAITLILARRGVGLDRHPHHTHDAVERSPRRRDRCECRARSCSSSRWRIATSSTCSTSSTRCSSRAEHPSGTRSERRTVVRGRFGGRTLRQDACALRRRPRRDGCAGLPSRGPHRTSVAVHAPGSRRRRGRRGRRRAYDRSRPCPSLTASLRSSISRTATSIAFRPPTA